MDKAFTQMKICLATDTLSVCPDHILPLHIYTDASDYHKGAYILHPIHPLAYYTQKLNGAYTSCACMEEELLSLVMILK